MRESPAGKSAVRSGKIALKAFIRKAGNYTSRFILALFFCQGQIKTRTFYRETLRGEETGAGETADGGKEEGQPCHNQSEEDDGSVETGRNRSDE